MSFISPVATDTSGNAKTTGSLQSLGKDDFLQLLVNKLRYQDPLNPMQDEDFIAQLAQFSSLEQMNNIAEGISQANDTDFLQMQSLNNALATNLLGMDVVTSMDGLYYDGENSAKVNYSTDQYASQMTFSIWDSSGEFVTSITEEDVEVGTHTISWDGRDSLGNTQPEGYYTVSAEGVDASGDTFTPPVTMVVKVDSVIYKDGVAYLRAGGLELSLGEVIAVSKPDEEYDSSSSIAAEVPLPAEVNIPKNLGRIIRNAQELY